MHILENDFLEVRINSKGAELQRLYHKQTHIEHLWNGDPTFWGKYSPVLFPIVGSLKNNTYYYDNKAYTLPRHGFAREKEFAVKNQTENAISFSLTYDDDTLKVYPFLFELEITYTLYEAVLTCIYDVKNVGETEMYFSIGAHPAFVVPFFLDSSYNDYYLEFEKEEQLTRWKLTDDGLISNTTEGIVLQEKKLFLTHQLFESDAIVMKDVESNKIKLCTDKSKHGISFEFINAPFFGIWAAPKAPFVCLEPWCGIADSANHNQLLQQKEGINQLLPSQKFTSSWAVECF